MPTVRTTNRSGQTAEVQVDDEMVTTLKGKVRQDDLESVEVIDESTDADAFVEVPVEYRPRPSVIVAAAAVDDSDTADAIATPVVVIDERKSAPGQVVPDVDTSYDEDSGADIDALRAEYEQAFGQAPDGRWKAPRLRKEIDAHNAKG